MRSRVVRNVMTKHTTHSTAHRPMVFCHPAALSPWPNFATSGSVNPPTASCASIADTNRNDESFVRSAESPVITPVRAEYGVLLAEYSVMSRMFVAPAHSSFHVVAKFGTVYAQIITTPQGIAVHSTHGRNFPQRVLVRSASTPIIGSKNASHRRPTSSIVPAAAAVIPSVSV